MAGRLPRQVAVGVHVLRFQEIRRAVGPGAEIVTAGLAQALLENARDLPVLRMDVAHGRIAEMRHVLHHQKDGAVVDTGAETCAPRRPVAVLVVAHTLHAARLHVELEGGDPVLLGV